MHKGHSSLCPRKEFGYSKIKWLIKNYFAATNGKKWALDSPRFVVYGDHCTEWQMSLEIHSIHNASGIKSISMYLKCLSPSSSRIRGNWKVFSPFEEHEVLQEVDCDFEEKKTFGVPLCSAFRLDDVMQFNTTDTLVLKCQLIVYSKERKMYDRPKDLGLRSLSQDMRVLYRTSKNHDIHMYAGGELVKAHKSVLCSRSDFLKDLIEQTDSEIDLPGLTLEGIKYVFGYLYSGHLNYVLRTPSFSILKCIKHLKIKELEVYYKKDAVVLLSEYGTREHVLEWNMSDIDLGRQNCFMSPVFHEKDLNMSFRLYFYPEGFTDRENAYVSIFIEIVDGSFLQTPYLEFAVKVSNDSIQYLQRKRWSRDTVTFGLESFLLKETFKDLTKDGGIRILCNVKYFSKSGSSKYENKIRPGIAVDTEHHFELFARQISRLYESGLYSDLTVTCEGGSVKVHSCILGARSYVLKEKFHRVKDGEEMGSILLQNTKYEDFRNFLSYIYSGKLPTHDFEEILKLYESAEEFSILPLKYTCSSVLQKNLNMHNIPRLRSLADKSKDYKLKKCAEKYLYSYNYLMAQMMGVLERINMNELNE